MYVCVIESDIVFSRVHFWHYCTARFAGVKSDERVKLAYLIILFFGSCQAAADGVQAITDIGPREVEIRR